MAQRQPSLLFLHSQQCLELLLLPGTNDRQNLQGRLVSCLLLPLSHCFSFQETVLQLHKVTSKKDSVGIRVCVPTRFFSQLGETTAQKQQAFFTNLVKLKPFLKSDTHLILPFPTSCHECHPSWPLILYFNVKKYDSTLLSLSHFII